MEIPAKDWRAFTGRLAALDNKAAKAIEDFINGYGGLDLTPRDELIEYAYAVATKYGEGAAALAAAMYDAVARLQRASVEDAEPADTATYQETAKAINGAAKFSTDPAVIGAAVGRLVKLAGVDTTAKNAIRDKAEWAWVAEGDTCAYCLMIAAEGWHKAKASALNDGHAEHVHANCDCTYSVRFDRSSTVGGYNPDKYKRIVANADTDGEPRTQENVMNALRREFYAENSDEINAQKRDAYERSKEREASEAEEDDI